MQKNYYQIRTHSEYSLLDGVFSIPELVKEIEKKGSLSVGLTDFDGMGGLVDFTRECSYRGIKQIYGGEFLLTEEMKIDSVNDEILKFRDRQDEIATEIKDIDYDLKQLQKKQEKGDYSEEDEIAIQIAELTFNKTTLENESSEIDKKVSVLNDKLLEEFKYRSKIAFISKNWYGYVSLCGINNASQIEGNVDSTGRINREIIEQNKTGLICILDGLHGPLQRYLINGQQEKAREFAQWAKKTFGEDLYIELQPHKHRHIAYTAKKVYDIAKEFGIKILITNAPRYAKKEDIWIRKTLLCKKVGSSYGKYSTIDTVETVLNGCLDSPYIDTYQLMDYDEIFNLSKAIFSSFMSEEEISEAINETKVISDQCEEYELRSAPRLPKYPYTLPGEDEKAMLKRVTHEKLVEYAEKKAFVKERLGEYQDLLEEELQVICDLGFAGYFLIEREIILWAKEYEFVGPGRGSAAGALVALLTGITSNIDPIQENLMFERFLSYGRAKGTEFHLFSRNIDGFIQPFVSNYGVFSKDDGTDITGKFKKVKLFDEVFKEEIEANIELLNKNGIRFEETGTLVDSVSDEQLKELENKVIEKAKILDEEYKKFGITNLLSEVEREFRILFDQQKRDLAMFYIMDLIKVKGYNKTNSYIADILGITTKQYIVPSDKYDELPELQMLSTRDYPDIDADFMQVVDKDNLYEFVRHRFGEDKVFRVGTYQKFGVKACINLILSCLEVPPMKVREMMKPLDLSQLGEMGALLEEKGEDEDHHDEDSDELEFNEEAIAKVKEFLMTSSEELAEILSRYNYVIPTIFGLLNKKYSTGSHAGGVLISDIPTSKYMPLVGKNKWKCATAYIENGSYKKMSSVGGIKFDLLKLKTLNIVSEVCRKAGIERKDLYNIGPEEYRSEESSAIYKDIVGKGLYSGLFQIGDNSSARFVADQMLKVPFQQFESNISFNDLSAMSAANRPAAIAASLQDQHGETVVGAHNYFYRIKEGTIKEDYYGSKIFERLTKNTLGMILYQEQTMMLAQDLCGFDEEETNKFRSDLLKKMYKLGGRYSPEGSKLYEKNWKKFNEGSKLDKYISVYKGKEFIGPQKRLDFIEKNKKIKLENRQFYEAGLDEVNAKKLTDLVLLFSEYGFNKAHCDSYALITHWTILLKHRFPTTFMSVLLDFSVTSTSIKDAEKQGIQIVPPDINVSKGDMTPDEANKLIYWGMTGVKGAGNSIYYVSRGREVYGDFKSIAEINLFVPKRQFGKRAIDPLIRVGAFDKFFENRKVLLHYYLEGVYTNVKLPKLPADFERITENNEQYEELWKAIRLEDYENPIFEQLKIDEEKRKSLKIQMTAFYGELEESRRQEKQILSEIEGIADMTIKEKRDIELELCGHPFTKRKYTQNQLNLMKFVQDRKSEGYIGGEITNVQEHIDKRGGLMAWISIENGEDYWNRIVCFASNYEHIKSRVEIGGFICFKPRFQDNISIDRKILTDQDSEFDNIEEVEEGTKEVELSFKEITEEAKEKKERMERKYKDSTLVFAKVNSTRKVKDKNTGSVFMISQCLTTDGESNANNDKQDFFIGEDIIYIHGKRFKEEGNLILVRGRSKFSFKEKKTYFIVEEAYSIS